MDELPIVLTNYNKPIAVVSKYEKDKVVSENGSPAESEKKEAFEGLKRQFFSPQPKSAIKGGKMK